MGGELASTARQRIAAKICFVFSRLLEPADIADIATVVALGTPS